MDTASKKIFKKTNKMGKDIEDLAYSFGKKVEKVGKQKKEKGYFD
jgi:hypothetical protein